MAKVRIHPSRLAGSIAIPPSKSQTMRALLFALMAHGKSRISSPLHSPDTAAMLEAISQFGAKIEREEEGFIIEGVGGKLKPASDVIQCGNSGQVLRFIGALAALSSSYTILTGDASIRQNRPVKPLLDALTQLGAFATSSRLDGHAPIVIKGPLKGGAATLAGEDSQPISGLLMLGAFTPLELRVTNPGEKPWVALTLSWLDRFAIPYENRNFEHYKMEGGANIPPFEYTVPGDFSSAAFPLVAASLTRSTIELQNLDYNDPQGDRAIFSLLKTMGTIDINDCIDALPILAVAACFASKETQIVNGAIARRKESDRIHAIASELKKMGALIEERPDGLLIRPSSLRGSLDLESHQDHRIAMALSVAALAAEGESLIHGVECATKSYPTFFDDFKKLGARMSVD